MIVGIDASNLRGGGGRTHLIELVRHASNTIPGVDRVIVWGSAETLDLLPNRPWLLPSHHRMLDGNFVHRTAWQNAVLPAIARSQCDVLFAPGGTASPLIRPRVVMSQNLLPFDAESRSGYGLTAMRGRLEILRIAQTRSFSSADGVIFLTRFARDEVSRQLPRPPSRVAVIPHGISSRFRGEPRLGLAPDAYGRERPFRLLYVSTVSPYKNQCILAEAVAEVRRELAVEIEFVGGADTHRSLEVFRAATRRIDPSGGFLHYRGLVSFDEMHRCYQNADGFVFASSCENMPNILLEAMASGLPIACSERGPMPEILRDGGLYFDPERVTDTARALRALILDWDTRRASAAQARVLADEFTWERAARDTFGFVVDVATEARRSGAGGVPP